MSHYEGTYRVLRNFQFSCESLRLITLHSSRGDSHKIQSHRILDQHGRTDPGMRRTTHSGIMHYFGCQKKAIKVAHYHQ